MCEIKGTQGYEEVLQPFIEATKSIDFQVLHQDFLPFIPVQSGLILDVGAGIGRDAYELSKMGHTVVAVEPLQAFRMAGMDMYASSSIKWFDDALPGLKHLEEYLGTFDFILISGVWHHLDEVEQYTGFLRIRQLLKKRGLTTISLRNGPSGAGRHTFPTDIRRMVALAESLGMQIRLRISNQHSLVRNKKHVFWSRVVFQK